MNVGELREALKDVAGDVLVVMSSDAEGNGYSPLAQTDVGGSVYHADSTWSGEVYDLEDSDYDEDDLTEAVPVVVLWPTN